MAGSNPGKLVTQQAHTDQEAVMYSLGPWLVGMCLDLFLQGILTSQFFNYYAWYGKSDTWKLTAGVGALAVMTTLKTIQALYAFFSFFSCCADHHGSAIVWVQDIVYFNDLNSALQMRFSVWYQMGNPIMVAFIAFHVQCYFCHRLWAISSTRYWVVSPILFLYVFSLGAAAVATYYIALADPRLGYWLSVHYATVFVGDVLLAVALAYFLLRTKKRVLPQTKNLFDSWIRLTFQTGAPAVIVALLSLIFIFLPDPYVKGISSAFTQPLPKLYAISMMWTLNARRDIRINSSSLSIYTSPNYAHDFPSPTFPRSRFTHEIPMNRFQTSGSSMLFTDADSTKQGQTTSTTAGDNVSCL